MKKLIRDSHDNDGSIVTASKNVDQVINGVLYVDDVDAFDFDDFDDSGDICFKSYEDYAAWMERYYES